MLSESQKIVYTESLLLELNRKTWRDALDAAEWAECENENDPELLTRIAHEKVKFDTAMERWRESKRRMRDLKLSTHTLYMSPCCFDDALGYEFVEAFESEAFESPCAGQAVYKVEVTPLETANRNAPPHPLYSRFKSHVCIPLGNRLHLYPDPSLRRHSADGTLAPTTEESDEFMWARVEFKGTVHIREGATDEKI